MKVNKVLRAAAIAVSTAGIVAVITLLISHRVRAEDESESDAKLAEIGLKIAPPFINMKGKDPTLVGLGSFIVHGQPDCKGCQGSDPGNDERGHGNPVFPRT